MLGGSYDYFYFKVEEVAGQITSEPGYTGSSVALREAAFKIHLLKVAKALKAIELNGMILVTPIRTKGI